MTKKKAVKKAKPASKPAKAASKKTTTSTKKSSAAKSKAKPAAPKKAAKAVAKKTAKKTVTKPAKAAPVKSKPVKATPAKTVKAAPAKAVKAVAAKAVKAVAPKTAASKEKAKPVVPKVKDEGRILAESVVNGILEKKGQNLVWLDLRSIENAVCDYFIICEGNSNTQVDAIAQSVVDVVKKETGQRAYRSEGWENALWILIDYVNVVVHVFERDTRHFYNLESLWADAEEIKVNQ